MLSSLVSTETLVNAAPQLQVGKLKSNQKISTEQGDLGNVLSNGSRFGSAVVGLGDLNGDGVDDIAVGEPNAVEGGDVEHKGAVWILFLKRNGKVKTKQEISAAAGGLDVGTEAYSSFGAALANLGDLDGDGVTDLAVGLPLTDADGPGKGAVWILFLKNDGTVKQQQIISATTVDGLKLDDEDFFGSALANLGDLDGDGRIELAVGAPGDDDGGEDGSRGAIWVLTLTHDGKVYRKQKISASGGFDGPLAEFDQLGQSLAVLGDVNQDGVTDMAAGVSRLDDEEIQARGAIWLLFMKADGTIDHQQEISQLSGLFGAGPSDGARYGSALAGIGDTNGDGIPDLVVGAPSHRDNTKKRDQGAIWILSLKRDGLVEDASRLTTKTDKLRSDLDKDDQFGWSIANLGDLDGDDKVDLVIGAPGDDDGGDERGAVWLALLK